MRIQLDTVVDTTITDGVNGVEAIRTARVTGVGGSPALRARNALTAPGLPRIGDRHPAYSDLQALEISLQAIDVESWDVKITYRQPVASELARIAALGSVVNREWFAVTVTEERTEDINGNPLYHWYTGFPLTPNILEGNAGLSFRKPTALQFVAKNELARIQKPSLGTRITMVESEPIERRIGFSGSINGGFWDGYPEETWLVGGLDSVWDRDRWRNTYELYYNPESWRFRSRVEYFGAPPSDAVLGNGIADFDVYPKANFNGLPFKLR